MAFISFVATAVSYSRLILLCCLSTVAMAELYGQLPQPLALQIKPTGSYLGIRLVDIDEERSKALKLNDLFGVEIAAVEEGAAADQAGIRPGDVILFYNGEKVLGAQQFIRLVAETPQGRRVNTVCWRAGMKKEIVVTTGTPHSRTSQEDLNSSRLRITDVPSPMMLWRNLVLGMESESLNEQLIQAFGVKQGILIWTVTPAYPAQRSGLRAGDVLTGFCGHPIHSPRELGVIMEQLQNSQKPISAELVRDHKAISLSISLDGER
jgi:serine protease Do